MGNTVISEPILVFTHPACKCLYSAYMLPCQVLRWYYCIEYQQAINLMFALDQLSWMIQYPGMLNQRSIAYH